MDPPKLPTRRSRKRRYPVKRLTEQDTAELNKEDGTSLECVQFPLQGSELKCTQPLKSSSVADQHGEPDMPKCTTHDPKIHLVSVLTDCEDKTNKNEMENEEKMPVLVNQPNDGSEGIETTALRNEMCTEDSSEDHMMETNQEIDDVTNKQMSQKSVVAGSAMKRRRMGMCHLSEKERSQLLPNCAKRDEKHNTENTIEIVAEALSSSLQATENMLQIDINTVSIQSNKKDREEPGVKCMTIDGTTVMCDPESTEMNVSEADQTREPDPEVKPNHCPLKKNESQSRKMTVSVGAVTACESDINLCKSENLKDADPVLTSQFHSCAEKQGVLTRSQSEVHVTANPSDVFDTVCEPQSQELQTNMGQIVGHTDPKAAMHHSKTHMREQPIQQEPQGARGNEIHACVDGHHNFNNSSNQTEVTPTEDKATPLQLDSDAKKTMEKKENEALILTSMSSTETDMTCSSVEMCNGHVTPKGSGETSISPLNEMHNKDAATVSMGPLQSGAEGLDYVSDSQLNTIVMIEEVVDVENGAPLEPSYEDGSELIHGLIRELSSLNRTVMATFREMENLRRRVKNSRNAIR